MTEDKDMFENGNKDLRKTIYNEAGDNIKPYRLNKSISNFSRFNGKRTINLNLKGSGIYFPM
jgi:hypothetical protein